MDIKNTISTFDKYINNVLFTWGGENELERAKFGLFEEAGEILGKEKKRLRGDKMDFDNDVKKEIGDFLYYLRLFGHLNKCELQNSIVLHEFTFSNFQTWFCYDYAEFVDEPKIMYAKMFNNIIYLINYLNYDFEEIIKMNVDKLSKRLEKGTIKGSGDNR